MKRITIGLASLGLFIAGCGGIVVVDSEQEPNVDWSVFECKSCSDMLEGFNYEKSNICEGSLDTWKTLGASICYNSIQDDVPCYKECKNSLCLDTQPTTDACISCISDNGNDKMQSGLIECLMTDSLKFDYEIDGKKYITETIKQWTPDLINKWKDALDQELRKRHK